MKFSHLLIALTLTVTAARAADPAKKNVYPPQPWAAWVEPDFPFFSSILDARREGTGAKAESVFDYLAPDPTGELASSLHESGNQFVP